MGIIIARIVGLLATIGIGAGINYLALPAWNLRNPALWAFFLVVVAIGAVIQWIIDYFEDENYLGIKIGGGLTAVVLVVLIVGGLTSWQLFNATEYHNIIMMEEGNFEEDINPIQNVENLSIVDMETAERLGDRTIGSIKNAAWYEVDDEYNLIKYQGEQYRISPLNYGGYFKSQKAKYDGIPGYVLVNTSTQEAKYVELETGMRYSPSAHWSFDLKRHLREQYSSYIFGNHYFEIDEEGNPYWITAVKNPTIGMFGGKKEESFIITNACTGESKEYKSEELPEWVDHAYSLEYLMCVAQYNLSYVNGFWNALFAQTNVLNTTYEYRNDGSEEGTVAFAGYNTAITADGDIVFYTGLTPASNAQSNVGFILANPRTGVITRYTCSGAEESSAQASAESLVQDLKYVATFPTIINVEGEETYFMLLKDKAGLVQRYALCNVENYTKVVQAATLEDAVSQYLAKLGNLDIQQNESETQKTEGTISELYQAQIDGCTFYYFKLEGSDNLYMSSIKNSNKQVLLKVGTKISIEYVPATEDAVFIVQKINF